MSRLEMAECPMKPTTKRSKVPPRRNSTMVGTGCPASRWASSDTPFRPASSLACSMTAAKRRPASSFSSSISSIVAAKRGISSIQIMCSSPPHLSAKSIAAERPPARRAIRHSQQGSSETLASPSGQPASRPRLARDEPNENRQRCGLQQCRGEDDGGDDTDRRRRDAEQPEIRPDDAARALIGHVAEQADDAKKDDEDDGGAARQHLAIPDFACIALRHSHLHCPGWACSSSGRNWG